MKNLIGKGREAIDLIIDGGSFRENTIDDTTVVDDFYGPGAVIGTALLDAKPCTVISNDAQVRNKRFRSAYAGLIGLEEAYKMSLAVYYTIEADKEKKQLEKRPVLLIVDTPGNVPGKIEEMFGMTTATGAYQLALAEARKAGHPVIAMVIGRAISGGFLCHGLQADMVLSLSKEYGTMIHVMPLSSVARITALPIEKLQKLAENDPVFASGAEFFWKLGGIEEIIEQIDEMRDAVIQHIEKIRSLKETGQEETLGPVGRARLGEERGGRLMKIKIADLMHSEFEKISEKYISA